MPKLMLVSHNYYPEPTGIPYYNTEFAEWFQRRGWEVTVLTGIPHYPAWRVFDGYEHIDYGNGRGDEIINNVKVRRVRHFVPSPPVSGAGRLRMDASYLLQWTQRIASLQERPDIIVGVSPPFMIGGLLLRLRRMMRAPIVYHVQDLQVDAALDLKMLPWWMAWHLRRIERWQLERMDLVTACGRGMLGRISAKGRLRIRPRHWPNWADIDKLKPWTEADGINPERISMNAGGDPANVSVLYSGNLGKKQGLDVLLDAARHWRDDPQIFLTIAGSGAERDSIRLKINDLDHVGLRDLCPPDRLRATLAAADIHVIPQKREAADLVLPSKLLNILAVGRPVVATAVPGTELADVVEKAGAGYVVPPENPQALAEAVRSLAANPQRRAEMGASGRAWIVANLNIDKVLIDLERQFLALIRATSREFKD